MKLEITLDNPLSQLPMYLYHSFNGIWRQFNVLIPYIAKKEEYLKMQLLQRSSMSPRLTTNALESKANKKDVDIVKIRIAFPDSKLQG